MIYSNTGTVYQSYGDYYDVSAYSQLKFEMSTGYMGAVDVYGIRGVS